MTKITIKEKIIIWFWEKLKKKFPLTNWRWFIFFCWDCVFLSLSSLIISSRVSSAKSLLFGGQVHHYRHPHHQPSAIESSNQYTQILAIYKTWKWKKCYISSFFLLCVSCISAVWKIESTGDYCIWFAIEIWFFHSLSH